MATERVKPIVLKFTDTNEEYTLEFNRETVSFAENRGFDVDSVSKFPMTKFPELFWYAFRMHHKSMSRGQTDKIFFEQLGGFEGLPEGFAERLGALYNTPFTAMSEGVEKNPNLTVEF